MEDGRAVSLTGTAMAETVSRRQARPDGSLQAGLRWAGQGSNLRPWD